jgi:hypothetical protein
LPLCRSISVHGDEVLGALLLGVGPSPRVRGRLRHPARAAHRGPARRPLAAAGIGYTAAPRWGPGHMRTRNDRQSVAGDTTEPVGRPPLDPRDAPTDPGGFGIRNGTAIHAPDDDAERAHEEANALLLALRPSRAAVFPTGAEAFSAPEHAPPRAHTVPKLAPVIAPEPTPLPTPIVDTRAPLEAAPVSPPPATGRRPGSTVLVDWRLRRVRRRKITAAVATSAIVGAVGGLVIVLMHRTDAAGVVPPSAAPKAPPMSTPLPEASTQAPLASSAPVVRPVAPTPPPSTNSAQKAQAPLVSSPPRPPMRVPQPPVRIGASQPSTPPALPTSIEPHPLPRPSASSSSILTTFEGFPK